MSLQEALKLLRLELGLTQEDLAKKLKKTYLTVNRWENGRSFPSRSNAKTILKLAEDGHASDNCISYLNDVLIPETRRSLSATAYGFPDIDREFFFQLADGSTNALYVIEAGTYRLLYVNRKAESEAVCYISKMGTSIEERKLADQADKRCFHYFSDRSEPCPFCPLMEIKRDGYKDIILTIPESGRKLMIRAKTAAMKGTSVYIIYMTDITQEDAERNALYTLTNDIPIGVGIYNVYMYDRIELVFMNKALSGIIGEERVRTLMKEGTTDICLVHPSDNILLKQEIHASIAEKRDVSIDIRMRIEEKKYRLFHLDGKMIKKGTEKITYYCTFKDLGEAKT